MSSATLSTQEPAPEQLSEPARIFNTFTAPSKTFTDLQRNSNWSVPFLLIAIVSLIFIYTIDRQVGFEQISKNEIAKSASRSEQLDKLPPDQKAKQMRVATTFTRVFSYVSPVFVLVAFLVTAAVLMGTFNLGMGASIPFMRAMAIVVYGSLPSILAALLGIVSLVAAGMSGSLDKEAFNINNAVATNPAYFMDPTSNKFLYGMASALDVFIIWNIVLMGIGFACNSKVKRGTAIGAVAGWYLVWKVGTAAIALAFS